MIRLHFIYFFIYTFIPLNDQRAEQILHFLNKCPFGFRTFWICRLLNFFKKKYENKELNQKIEIIIDKIDGFSFYLTEWQKEQILKSILMTKVNDYFDEEMWLICSLLQKTKINKSKDCVYSFVNLYLYPKLSYIYKPKISLNKLKEIGVKIEDHFNFEKFISPMLVSDFSIQDFKKDFKFKCDFGDFRTRLSFFISLSKSYNPSNANSWIEEFSDQIFKYYYINGTEIIYLLKIYSLTKNNRVLEILEETGEDSFLIELVKDNWSFSSANEHSLLIVEKMKFSKDFKDFMKSASGFQSKKITKLCAQNFFCFKNHSEPKWINFNLIFLVYFCREFSLDFICKLLERVDFKDLGYTWEESDFRSMTLIGKNMPEDFRLNFIIESIERPFLFQSIKKEFESISIIDVNFKVNKFSTLLNLLQELEKIYQLNYFRIKKLNLIENFPILSRIDGLVFEEFRFEIPKTNYDLYVYGNKMRNCIAKYADKCELMQTIIVGVYLNESLLFNIEIGIDWKNQEHYTFPNISQHFQLSDSAGFFRKKVKQKRVILFFEKKMKGSFSIDVKNKIVQKLIETEIIDP